jgi:hypothetical protein
MGPSMCEQEAVGGRVYHLGARAMDRWSGQESHAGKACSDKELPGDRLSSEEGPPLH